MQDPTAGTRHTRRRVSVRKLYVHVRPIPARKVARWYWLSSDFHDASKPLRSLSLLISERYPRPVNGSAVAEATIANIEAAVREWWQRANSHHDNRAIFYFAATVHRKAKTWRCSPPTFAPTSSTPSWN
jgi:hypothetical protein